MARRPGSLLCVLSTWHFPSAPCTVLKVVRSNSSAAVSKLNQTLLWLSAEHELKSRTHGNIKKELRTNGTIRKELKTNGTLRAESKTNGTIRVE
ncbi:unnamed protein product [Bursaphelenchus okinawaensis]|uniref:Uncharacterized protein n=1 Tax=Bursaphelenchus okinawaensis TaxID=465554 RepID=A0A811KCN6_9BILA|nr:unnamed protein product [Bursaphelenchus okinawaensis]CAG9101081.1 unnamed protein product [Bursaphelenchus okinawaensis]